MPSRRNFLRQISAAPFGLRAFRRYMPMKEMALFVGTYTDGESEGIYRCRMSAASGALERIDSTGDIANPSFLALHPTEKYLYAVSETTSFADTDGGGVYAYSFDGGSLRPLNAKPSHGGAPCYVSAAPDAGHVLVANYLGGNVVALPIRSDGGLGGASDIEQHEGSSVNSERQEAPHAHCVRPDLSGRHILAADLGIDQVVIYRLEDGKLNRVGAAAVEAGAGPRHIAFHPGGGHVFVINELNSTIAVFRYNDGRMEPAQTISTLPAKYDGENSCADIHVSSDGRFVYGSNRGHDSMAVFGVDDQRRLSLIQHLPTGGSWPRNFTIDPTGRFLLVANQRSDNIVVFARDAATGKLSPTGQSLAIPSPVCLLFANRA